MRNTLLAIFLCLFGAWFFVPSLVVILDGDDPGAMPVPKPFSSLVLGAVLIALGVWFWRGGRRTAAAGLEDTP